MAVGRSATAERAASAARKRRIAEAARQAPPLRDVAVHEVRKELKRARVDASSAARCDRRHRPIGGRTSGFAMRRARSRACAMPR